MSLTAAREALNAEIELMLSMYPDEIHYDERASQLSFKQAKGSLDIRIPSAYPSGALPETIAATGPGKHDLRSEVKSIIASQTLGEPCLDAIITEFVDIIASLSAPAKAAEPSQQKTTIDDRDHKTVIIWLHHLLATGKRKQALSVKGPDASHVSGITKPGYPGVLVFSGQAAAVDSHVQTLKHLRWQAFQIRFEDQNAWSFAHGPGIVEVETMAEVVTEIEGYGTQKDQFMEAMKIK